MLYIRSISYHLYVISNRICEAILHTAHTKIFPIHRSWLRLISYNKYQLSLWRNHWWPYVQALC